MLREADTHRKQDIRRRAIARRYTLRHKNRANHDNSRDMSTSSLGGGSAPPGGPPYPSQLAPPAPSAVKTAHVFVRNRITSKRPQGKGVATHKRRGARESRRGVGGAGGGGVGKAGRRGKKQKNRQRIPSCLSYLSCDTCQALIICILFLGSHRHPTKLLYTRVVCPIGWLPIGLRREIQTIYITPWVAHGSPMGRSWQCVPRAAHGSSGKKTNNVHHPPTSQPSFFAQLLVYQYSI